MALGFSIAKANAMLDLWANQAMFIQVHTADPGPTAAIGIIGAGTTIRKAVTFANPAAGGIKASTAAITWAANEIADNVTPTHASYWTTGGNAGTTGVLLGTGTLPAGLVGTGTLTIPAGEVQASVNTLG